MSREIDWIIERHEKTNHFYDRYLPYSFHLRMVATVYEDWKHLLNDDSNLGFSEKIACYYAAYGHDLIEDTRTSYNDVLKVLGKPVADIIYAVSNEKGRNREERANEKYYEGIRNTPGAIFIKLCDRIANVQYGKLTKSDMFKKYKKENPKFIISLGFDGTNKNRLDPMVDYLNNLFNA